MTSAEPVANPIAALPGLGPGLLAYVMVSKFLQLHHLPLYRQQDVLSRHGIFVARSTLWRLDGSMCCSAPSVG